MSLLERLEELILRAKEDTCLETENMPDPEPVKEIKWPINCTVGPGLEGAIACETDIGYVHGAKGLLIYRGYDIFDLCAYSTFEEVSFLLLHGHLPAEEELKIFKKKLFNYLYLTDTERLLMSFPIEEMSTMAALRLGANLMRHKQTYRDKEDIEFLSRTISTDEDSIPMETKPRGEEKPIYEFHDKQFQYPKSMDGGLTSSEGFEDCYHLISGVASIAASVARLRKGHMPLEPKQGLSHAGNLLYMMSGEVPTPLEERIMDICLILHADHGMNASTFASLVVASTLSDIYFSIGSGIAALTGPLHGGANELVIQMLESIGNVENVKSWFQDALEKKKKIMGFGHRVYKTYDPRARVLGPLAEYLVQDNPENKRLFCVARALEKEVVATLGQTKKIFPNVDFYSGLVYKSMGIMTEMFTPIFAVARVSGWTARIIEYLTHNRIFRPRSLYIGEFNRQYIPLKDR